MKKTMKKMSRNVAAAMAALTLVSTCMGTSVKVHAAEPESESNIEVQGPEKNIIKGLISNTMGMIPFLGQTIGFATSEIFDCIWPEDGEIASITEKFDELSLQMKGQAQSILKNMYDDSMSSFNKDMTNLKEMTKYYLQEIDSYMKNDDLCDIDKAIRIGCLFEKSSSNLNDYINIISLCNKYVTGKTIHQYDHDSIFLKAYKSACDKTTVKSAFGGEAAEKAASYVNEISSILDNAERVEAMVLDAKISLANRLISLSDDEIKEIEARFPNQPKPLQLISEAHDPSKAEFNNWTKRVTDLKNEHDLIFDESNANSVVSRYNKMVEDYHFCYISESDFSTSPATITYIPLQSEMIGTDVWEQGLEYYVENWKKTDDFIAKLNDFTKKSGLNTSQINDIAQAMENMNSNDDTVFKVFESLDNFGFNVDDLVVKYTKKRLPKVPEKEIEGAQKWVLLNRTDPQLISDAEITIYGNCYSKGFNLYSEKFVDHKFFDAIYPKEVNKYDYHTFLGFQKGTMPEDPWATFNATACEIDGLSDNLQCGMVDALTINGVADPEENNIEIPEENEAIVLTVDENGQITGDKMNEAWTVAEDGTIILNKDNKFRFEGTVADKNIQNYGEIVDGNFKNVKMELVDNAVITKGTFEDCEITTNENAVIGEEVELINTTVIDAKDIVNPEEEEQKDNPQDVVEDTPVSENDMF